MFHCLARNEVFGNDEGNFALEIELEKCYEVQNQKLNSRNNTDEFHCLAGNEVLGKDDGSSALEIELEKCYEIKKIDEFHCLARSEALVKDEGSSAPGNRIREVSRNPKTEAE